ncbi:TMEM175 family protein [Lacticaseibacillus yichunensis]|uniref:TMEM175 family protein n=1 Tax=Lacticaseibacillus yichunensis TaxID=2486015 RepID=A0ABW4CSK8_9LACO|nr:TMEM175 family protein [Lacticaseibacillus yichunensis]
MSKQRLEAFTDGVIAIIITIMVLELRPPESGQLGALWGERYVFLIYAISFFNVAVYWNNHHHLFQIVKRVSGGVLWANMFFLFGLSLIPFVTSWVGANHVADYGPEMSYGIVILVIDIAYYILIRTLIRSDRRNQDIMSLVGRGYYKPIASIILNVVAIFAAFIWPTLTIILDMVTLLLWIKPEWRIEQHLQKND